MEVGSTMPITQSQSATCAFGGGSALGSPFVSGGGSGSLETGITIVDNSFLSMFIEQFAPGLQLSFSLALSLNDDEGGTPDRLTLFVLDSSAVAIPTLAPFGDFFLGVDLHSTGPVFDIYASDISRALSVGSPVSMAGPSVSAVDQLPVPEPATLSLLWPWSRHDQLATPSMIR